MVILGSIHNSISRPFFLLRTSKKSVIHTKSNPIPRPKHRTFPLTPPLNPTPHRITCTKRLPPLLSLLTLRMRKPIEAMVPPARAVRPDEPFLRFVLEAAVVATETPGGL